MKKINISGGILIFLGALLWSLNAPLVKLIALDGVMVCGMRSLIAAAVLLPFAKIRQLQWNKWMLTYAISYAALSFSIIRALETTDSAIAIGMQYTSIVWLWLLSLIQKKKTTYKESFTVFLVIFGVVLFMVTSSDGGNLSGNLTALSEGIFFLGMTVASPKATRDNPIGLTAVANLLTGVFVFVFLRPDMKPLLEATQVNWLILLILGAVQVAGGYGFYNMGLQKASPQKAAMLALWEMILGPVWVALFLGEYPDGGVVAGFIVILIGLFLDALWGKGRKEEKIEKHAGYGKAY